MNTTRLRRLSNISSVDSMDSVQDSILNHGDRRAFNIVLEAMNHYNNMARFRKERERVKRYVYGNQWGDIIYDPDTKEYKTEEQYIRDNGNEPLSNNLMRRLVRAVVGTYRSQDKEPICVARDRDEQKYGETMSTLLQYNMQLNQMKDLHARCFEDFLIGGLVIQRKWFGWRNDELDCWTDPVPVDMAFIDSNMRDYRGWDASIIGQIYDLSFNDLVTKLAKSPEDYKRLSDIYSTAKSYNRDYISNYCREFGHYKPENIDFLLSSEPSMCRVIEVWRKESKPRWRCRDYQNGDIFKIEIEDYETEVEAVNRERYEIAKEQGIPENEVPIIVAEWFIDSFWHYYILTPFGDILEEGDTPYAHKSHPYVFKPYPFIDGEIHSFASDFHDQQRYLNRLISIFDMIIRSSAKGVLVVPEECISEQMDLREIADEWHRSNGVIVIKMKDNPSGVMPKQISENSTNIGISEIINLQLKFFEDISGVNGALQGKPGYSSTSGAKYAQETQNATTSLLDLLETYSSFVVDGAYKDVSNIQQFYDDRRIANIAGKSSRLSVDEAKKIRNVKFDFSIVESTSTPAYRTLSNEFLMEIWRSKQIDLELLLENIDLPFADELLQAVKTRNEEANAGQQLPVDVAQMMSQNANPQALAMAQQYLKG